MLRMAVEKKTGTSQIAPSADSVSMRMSPTFDSMPD